MPNKKEVKIYNRKYRIAHKKEIRAYRKVYYKANKEQEQIQTKIWRKANPEKIKASGQAWRAANSKKLKLERQAYYKAHRDEVRAQAQAWRKTNPGKRQEQVYKRRARQYQTQIQPINEKEIHLRDGWICQICHKRVDKRLKYPDPMSPSLDHIIPLSKGGGHTYNNVQLAHFKCNRNKKANILPQGEQLRMF